MCITVCAGCSTHEQDELFTLVTVVPQMSDGSEVIKVNGEIKFVNVNTAETAEANYSLVENTYRLVKGLYMIENIKGTVTYINEGITYETQLSSDVINSVEYELLKDVEILNIILRM